MDRINAHRYTGHAEKSGLQRHSIGEHYPWDVIAVGDLQPTEWQAINHVTGQRGPRRSCIRQAVADRGALQSRATILAGLLAAGAVHTWDEIVAAAPPVDAHQLVLDHVRADRARQDPAQVLIERSPYTIVGVGEEHAVLDRRTGRLGNRWRTYREALIDAHGLAVRNLNHS